MEAAREILLALWACLLFGIGLIVSNMTNPAKVPAYLDLTGAWDPSLGIVLGGALLAAMPAYTIARRLRHTLLGERLDLPTAARIDAWLLLGSVLFWAGWGLAGYCPGQLWRPCCQAQSNRSCFSTRRWRERRSSRFWSRRCVKAAIKALDNALAHHAGLLTKACCLPQTMLTTWLTMLFP